MLEILNIVDDPINLFVDPTQVNENEIVRFAAHLAFLWLSAGKDSSRGAVVLGLLATG